MQKGYLSAQVRHLVDTKKDSSSKITNVYDEWKTLADAVPNLLTNAGKDLLHNYGYIDVTATAVTAVGFNFIALTEATITPGVTDTTLSSEISTNGLQRAAATTATHTPAANTSVIDRKSTTSE